jgi:hypothetical protein
MRTSIGKRLFAGRGLDRYLAQAPAKITNAARSFHSDEGLRGDALVAKLRKEFHLEALGFDMISSLDVRAQAAPYVNRAGDKMIGHVAYARLPYTGNPVFFEAPIAPGFEPQFLVRVNRSSLKLMTFVPSLDLTEFRDAAVEEAHRLRALVEEIRPVMRQQDQEVLRLVELAVRTDVLG